ncbi:hypothetical protein DP23_4354 [Ralstonia pickettii]|nr:hypothetical protein DP23_4354 [Ralstonia pickettii]
MLAQPYQHRRATLNAIASLCLFVGQLAFFHLLNHCQLKSQRVVPLRSLLLPFHLDAHSLSGKKCQPYSGRVTDMRSGVTS